MSTPDATSGPTPVPSLRGVTAYVSGGPGVPIDLDLAGNEGLPPSDDLLRHLAEIDGERIRRYPKPAEFEALIGTRFGVTADRVIATPGADEAIDRVCRTMLSPDREIVVPTPTFEMVPRYAALAGGHLVAVPWTRGPFPTGAVIAAMTSRTSVVAIVSPNNPSGAVASRNDIEAVAEAAPHAVVLLDLAYVEFADEDPTEFALSLPNVVVTRTLSKAWGLAGLRTGFALGPANIITWMRAAGGPYGVSQLSMWAAAAVLERRQHAMDAFVERVRRERAALELLLRDLGLDALPSQANFVTAVTEHSAAIGDALAHHRIRVRVWLGDPERELLVRITCPGDDADFQRLCGALRQTLPAIPEVDRGVR